MKKALIVGVGGFVGSHLAEYLMSKNIQTSGIVHPNHPSNNLKLPANKLRVIECDILDKKKVLENLHNNQFDYIFHLAAFSSPPESFKKPIQTLENNIVGQLNLLESLVKVKSKAKILIIGSADEYGEIKSNDLPISESVPLKPLSPYAVSKVAQDFLGYQYFLHHNLNIVRIRPFNHIGPRQSTLFVVSAFASRLAKLEKKGGGKLPVGNLNTMRDFTDVRDIARAYLLALQKCKIGEVYNIGSGKAYKISGILNKLISLTHADIQITKSNKLYRIAEIPKIVCDSTKFTRATGWKPLLSIDQTLSDTINYERNQIN